MEMVEGVTKNEEEGTENMTQTESNTKVFSSRKHILSRHLGQFISPRKI